MPANTNALPGCLLLTKAHKPPKLLIGSCRLHLSTVLFTRNVNIETLCGPQALQPDRSGSCMGHFWLVSLQQNRRLRLWSGSTVAPLQYKNSYQQLDPIQREKRVAPTGKLSVAAQATCALSTSFSTLTSGISSDWASHSTLGDAGVVAMCSCVFSAARCVSSQA